MSSGPKGRPFRVECTSSAPSRSRLYELLPARSTERRRRHPRELLELRTQMRRAAESGDELVYKAIMEKGAAFVKAHIDSLTVNFHTRDPKDMILNSVGSELLFVGEVDDAIAAFTLNTEMFPDMANCWDSLGEAWLKKGDKKKALSCYSKALELDPKLPSALEMVKELLR